MIPLWAIVKLTLKSAVRSRIFHVMFFLLIAAMAALPYYIVDDGTAEGHIKVALRYSLGAISFLLSLSTVWVGCFVMSRDIETYQLHMVSTKPVSMARIWIGKWLGVVLLHLSLLAISAATAYAIIKYNYYSSEYTEEQKWKINNEVFTGRRVYMPLLPDIDSLVRREYQERKKAAAERNVAELSVANTPASIPGMDSDESKIYEVRKKVISNLGEVVFGPSNTKVWTYAGVSGREKSLLFLRYRLYVDRVSQKDQKETYGQFFVKVKTPPEVVEKWKGEGVSVPEMPTDIFFPLSPYPENIMGATYRELVLPPTAVGAGGEVQVAYANYDLDKKPVFFQIADGPKLLAKVAGFTENYVRGTAMIAIALMFLAGLSCAIGGVMSLPTAVFFVVSYVMLSIFASYILDLETLYDEGYSEPLTWSSLPDYMAKKLSRAIVVFSVPIHRMDVSDVLASGELIELGTLGRTFIQYFLVKGGIIFVVCAFFYSRRELGLEVRK